MIVEPMTDAELEMVEKLFDPAGPHMWSGLKTRSALGIIARLRAAEAERDAAVARAMPEPVLVRTVEEVEALPGGHFYLVRRPWDARAMPWACLAVGSHKRLWRMLGSTVRSGCGALVGALISGPLPDLPTPTAAQEATDAP